MLDYQRFEILISTNLGQDKVRILWFPSDSPIPPSLKREIIDYWKQFNNQHFNGQLARLDKWKLENSNLTLWLSKTDYRTLLYSNDHIDHIEQKWGDEHVCKALGISSVVISKDQYLLYMKRSHSVGEYPGCFDIFGGHVDAPASLNQAPDVFNAIKTELEEELGLPPHLQNCFCIGLARVTENQKPELFFKTHCSLTMKEIIVLAGGAKDRGEYTTILYLKKDYDQLSALLRDKSEEFSPSAAAGLTLFLNQL